MTWRSPQRVECFLGAFSDSSLGYWIQRSQYFDGLSFQLWAIIGRPAHRKVVETSFQHCAGKTGYTTSCHCMRLCTSTPIRNRHRHGLVGRSR